VLDLRPDLRVKAIREAGRRADPIIPFSCRPRRIHSARIPVATLPSLRHLAEFGHPEVVSLGRFDTIVQVQDDDNIRPIKIAPASAACP
jgi:hypothetical protein